MPFRIAIFQFEPVRNNVEQNIMTIERHLSGVAADLIVLPEMANTGYLYTSPEALAPFAEECNENSPFISALGNLSTQTQGVIIAGYSEKAPEGLYNAAVAVSSEGILSNYRKTHLFDNEKVLFQPGNTGFQTFRWKEVTIGMMICFDWIFPESARLLALAGAQFIAHPANLVLPYCQKAMVTRSIENRVFTATANRIGTEELGEASLTFTGMSQVTDPSGSVLYRAPTDRPALHILEIDVDLASDKHITHRNDLFEDRRPEFYPQH
jgi:predicted amidohydrolase